MDNSQNFNQSQTPSYLIDDYEIERTFIQEYLTEIFYIFLLLTVIIIRFNKNIFKYFLNIILDVVLVVLVFFLYGETFVVIEKFSLINNWEFLESRDYIILSIISSSILFVLSLIILSIKIKLLNKYFKYWWENNNFKNALFKEMLKFCLPIIMLTFMSYWYTIYDTLKNPTF